MLTRNRRCVSSTPVFGRVQFLATGLQHHGLKGEDGSLTRGHGIRVVIGKIRQIRTDYQTAMVRRAVRGPDVQHAKWLSGMAQRLLLTDAHPYESKQQSDGTQEALERLQGDNLLQKNESLRSASEPTKTEPSAEDSQSMQQKWVVKKPKRVRGYTRPLIECLVKANREGRPIPSAREMFDSWKGNLPPEIVQMTFNKFEYYDSNGDTKWASIDSLRKAIQGFSVADSQLLNGR